MYRINRLRALEAGIFASGFRDNIDDIDAGHPEVDAALVASDTWISHAKEIHLLSVYEGRLTSILRKDRADLKALQAERQETREKAMNQAEIFVEHAESKGEVYDPGEDFQPPPPTVGSIFQLPKSPAAATANTATRSPITTISATNRRTQGRISAPSSTTKPPNPHDGILKPANSRNDNVP